MPSMLFRSRKDRGKPPGPCLPLPVELVLGVTQHMEKSDAHSLATVCRSWQGPAESVIWETVSLALGVSWDERCLGGEDSRAEVSLGPGDMTVTRRDETLADTPVDARLTWPAHCAEMERRVKEIEGAFSSRPQRAKHVRRLILEPTSRVWDGIVEQMWPSIERLELDLFGITGGGQQEAAKLVEQMCDNLRRMGPSGRLRVIELKLSGERSEDVITTLLRLAPNLTGLYLRQVPDDSPQMDKINPDKWSGITVNSLKRIDWTLQCCQLAPLVDHLIKQAPCLEDFRFEDDNWGEDELTTGAFKSLAEVQTLRRMRWHAVALRDPFRHFPDGGFKYLEELVLPDDLGLDMNNWALEYVPVPRLPSLRAILVPVLNVDPVVLPSSLRALAGHIPPHLVSDYMSAPALHYVQFGGPDQERPELDVTTWCDKRVTGVVIRTYGEGRNQLVHLRRLAIDAVNSEGFAAAEQDTRGSDEALNPSPHHCPGILHDCPHHWWEDLTDYRGRPVPSTVLCDFYNSLGEAPNWFQPSRLPMPEEALKILQDWWKRRPRRANPILDAISQRLRRLLLDDWRAR